jgi:methyltransferase
MMFFLIFIITVILQRLAELIIAKRNEKKLFSLGAIEYDSAGYKVIVAMHTMFFISLIAEYVFLRKGIGLSSFWIPLFILFLFTQFIRYWALASLGEFWNTRIIILAGSPRIRKGPYKFLDHPNYAAVIIELAVIPLMFDCYITAIVFTAANLLVLKRRIKIENQALAQLKGA